MSLENLVKIGQLKEHPPDAGEIQHLLAAAERNLADSRVTEISPETRFDAAYKAIMQAALAALMAHGFRPDTHRPGHHQTVLQCLSITVGMPASHLKVLDTLRRMRNLSDYTGGEVDESSVGDCLKEAERLLDEVRIWLHEHKPGLMGDNS